jgi:DNA-binding Lrp family transcriptional regulator
MADPLTHNRYPLRRRLADLDDVDRQLCRLLADDPNLSRRELGATIGLTDETISARLRILRQKNVIATTVAIDWQAAGYGAGAILRCVVRGDDLVRAAQPAMSMDNVVFTAVTSGCCDLVVALLAVDLAELRSTIAQLRARMAHVHVNGTDIVTDVISYNASTHTLPVEAWSADELPNPALTLDDTDRALIKLLAVAGDDSNRAIARSLGVSDATVRSRLRRLEDSNLMRVVTARDPIAFGDLTAHALAFLSLDDPAALSRLAKLPAVQACYATIAGSDGVVALGAADEQELSRVLTRDLRRDVGVPCVQVAHVVTVLRHRTHLVRLV